MDHEVSVKQVSLTLDSGFPLSSTSSNSASPPRDLGSPLSSLASDSGSPPRASSLVSIDLDADSAANMSVPSSSPRPRDSSSPTGSPEPESDSTSEPYSRASTPQTAASRSAKIQSAFRTLLRSPDFIVMSREAFFNTLFAFANRSMVFKDFEAHSYSWDTLILAALSLTMYSSPYRIAIAVLPQDTLHAPKLGTGSRKGDQTPDFKLLGWFGAETPGESNHSNSSYLFFIYEKKKESPTTPTATGRFFLRSAMEYLTASNIKQLGRQASLAFIQYKVKLVHVIIVVATYFSVLRYELPDPDMTDDQVEKLRWHMLLPTPLCVDEAVMKDSKTFSDCFLWALRHMTKAVDVPGPGGTFSIHFQPSWFDPISDKDFRLRDQELVIEKENIQDLINSTKADSNGVDSDENDDEDEEVAEAVKGEPSLNTPRRLANDPNATFQPTEELGRKAKAKAKGKGKAKAKGKGKGKRELSDDGDGDGNDDLLPDVFPRNPKGPSKRSKPV